MSSTPSNTTSPANAHLRAASIHPAPPSPSELDRSLLVSLFDPASDLSSTAAARGLSLLDVAHWLAQPHIQAQVEAIESLRALRREVWAEQLRQEAAEALRKAMNAAADPAECRRCANTILRATSPPRRHAPSPRERLAEREVPLCSAEGATRPPGRVGGGASAPLSPSSSSHLSDTLAQALATLRALGYDTTESELTDDELDALQDEELDADLDEELDDELDEYAADLTDAEMAEALALARQHLARPHDTS